ncbi:MAG: hypothetical protein ACE5NM_02785 [Sedimentisphaerales bacterium]
MKTLPYIRVRVSAFLLLILLVTADASIVPSEQQIPIVLGARVSPVERLAARELSDFLSKMYPSNSFTVSVRLPSKGPAILLGTAKSTQELGSLINENELGKSGSFTVKTLKRNGCDIGIIVGANPRATLYAVYALLEELGCGFYLSYDAVPTFDDKKFTFAQWKLTDVPLVGERIVFNWHNFLSSCSTWNLPEWKHWIRQAAKMRFTSIMVHAYGNNPMVSFTHNGQTKPVGYLSTTIKGRDWGTQHVNDVRRLYGAKGIFSEAVFGSEAAKVPDGQRVAAAKQLMKQVFTYAKSRGLDVTFALDVDTVSANPPNIIMTLPTSARLQSSGHPLVNPDTPEGLAYYKSLVESLLRDYPQIDRLVVWFRSGRTPWRRLTAKDFPPAWQAEYQAKLLRCPEVARLGDSPSMFAIAKIVQALRKALNEMGRKDVKLGIGTWGFSHLAAADAFMPRHVAFLPLDTQIKFDTAAVQQQIGAVSSGRAVIPIVWAHHDDRTYIGRPYTPFKNFASRLRECGAAGFGIIHWTTRPLDLYFKSLSQQIWSNTEDQRLRETCRQMAARTFGTEFRDLMVKYLMEWVTMGPQFGRETTDRFIDRPLSNPQKTIAMCRKRLELLQSVDTSSLKPLAREHLEYYKLLEHFFIEFYRNETMLQKSIALLKSGDLTGARKAVKMCSAESTIELYAQASKQYAVSQGERALIISLNLRWLPYFEAQRQAVGLSPVRLNFQPTQHDPLAQGAGRRTFYIDREGHLWIGLGEAETQVPAYGPVTITPKVSTSSEEEICKTYIKSEEPIHLKLKNITGGNLTPGTYQVHLLLPANVANGIGQYVFELSLRGSARGDIVADRIDLFERTKAGRKAVRLIYNLRIEQGYLEVELKPVHGHALLCGAILNRTAVPK